MASMFPISAQRESSQRFNNNVPKNIKYARDWYRSKQWSKNTKIRLSDAGSQNAGSIKNGILEISFKPDLGINFPSCAIPISTSEDHVDFINSLNFAYEQIQTCVTKMEEKKAAGKLKHCPTAKNPKGIVHV